MMKPRHIGTRALAATGIFGLLTGLVFSTILTALPVVAAPGINKTINFQGKVTNTDGTNVANGNYTFVFRLYNQQAPGGAAIWTETKSLAVTDGVFQNNLGSTTALPGSVDFNTDNIFLGMSFNGDPEMSPRIQFTASPYAFNSDLLDGLDSGAFAQLNPASAQSGSLNVTGDVKAGSSLQAPLVDTTTAVALNVGTTTAASVTVGRATATTNLTLQGSAATSWSATGASGSTTVGFRNPTATNAIWFPDAGGDICTTVASTCSSTYQAAGSYLQKSVNSTESSSSTVAGYQYVFTNNSTGSTSGVLSLTNSGASSTLRVTQSTNPGVGEALIRANNTAGSPTGNLIDLQINGTSVFSTNVNGQVTAGAYNGQTISSTASFTGTVAVATSLSTPVLKTADQNGAATHSPNLTIRSGNAAGSGSNSGDVTVDAGTATGTAGAVNIGTGNASGVTVGRMNTNFLLQGAAGTAGSKITATSGSFTTAVDFATPTDNRTIHFPDAGGTICTTDASTCGSAYIQNRSTAVQTGNFFLQSGAAAGLPTGVIEAAASQTGDLLQFQNSSGNPVAQVLVSGSMRAPSFGSVTTGKSLLSTNADTGGLVVTTQNDANKGLAIRANSATQSANLFELQNSTGEVNAAFDGLGNQLTLGRVATSGSTAAGKLRLSDGSLNGFAVTLDTNALTGSQDIHLPNESGVVCLQGKGSCGFVVGSASDFLRRNTANEQSGAVLTAGQYLYRFANDGGSTSNVLVLDGGSATGSTLKVVAGATPAANNALMFGQLSSTSGNLLDLWSGNAGSESSKFSINASGNVTGGTYNGQIISSAASFNGTLSTANTLTVNAGGLSVAGGATVTSGGLSVSGGTSINNDVNDAVNLNTGTSTGTVTVGGGASTLVIDTATVDLTAAGALSGITTITTSGDINNQTIGAASNFTGTVGVGGAMTLSGASGNQLAVTGAPTATANSSLVRLGAAISGGNNATDGGTYLGINLPATGAGSAADFLNFQANNSPKLKVSSTGLVDSAVGFAVAGTNGSTIAACGAGQYLGSFQSSGGLVIGGSCVAVPGSTAANQQLSNLSGTVAVNLSLTPGSDNLLDIGSASNRWRSGYFGTSVLTPTLDTIAAGTLNLGTNNATQINLNQNTVVSSGKTLTVNGVTTIQGSGNDAAFDVKIGSGGGSVLKVDTNNSRVGVNLGASAFSLGSSAGGLEVNGGLRLGGGGGNYADQVTTPVGNNVRSKINIPVYNPGDFGQILAFGIPSSAASPASNTARGIVVFDQRGYQSGATTSGANYTATPHQPSIGVFSPDESDIFGFSWEGTVNTAYLKSTDNNMNIRLGSGNLDVLTAQNVVGVAAVGIGNTAPNYRLDVGGDTNVSSGSTYRINGQSINTAGTLSNVAYLNQTNTFTGQTIYSGLATDITTAANEDLTLLANGTGQIVLNDTTQIATLGAADSTALLCRNSSNQIATCSAALTGSAFVQGGNTFGAAANLGTNDGNVLNLRTNNATRLTIATNGDLTMATGSNIRTANGTSSNGINLRSGDSTAGATGTMVVMSGAAVGGNSGSVTVDSGSSSGGTAGNLYIGTNNAPDITIGRAAARIFVQGLAGSGGSTTTMTNSGGTATTTVYFQSPTASASYRFTDPGTTGTYNICTQIASSCNTTYQAYSSTGYLVKNAAETSTASIAGDLLAFTNSNTGAAGVLALTNAGTSSALNITGSANPTSGQALIKVNNTNGTPSGNLIDLQTGGTSRLSVNTSGNVTTSGTINGQTISSTANFTGSMTVQGTLNAVTAIQANGSAGQASTCAAGQVLTGATYTMGILTTAGTCSAVGAGSYLAKDAQDTSSAAVNGGYLYGFTNSGTGAGTGVLSLTNSNSGGTGSVLSVTSAANMAAGQALILANNTNGSPSGSLIDLQVSAASKFNVSTAGVVTLAGGQAADIAVQSAAASANGNSLSLQAGTAGSGNQNGGSLNLQAGTATGTGTGGTTYVRGGSASSTGAGGGIQVLAANGGSAAASGLGPGGGIVLQAGSAAGSNNNNGGSITLTAGAATGTGTPGTVNIGTPVFTSVTETFTQTANGQSFNATQSDLDSYGTIVMNVTGAFTGATINMPAPTNTTAGRMILVSAASGSASFTLAATGMSSVNMGAGNTATLIWNGTGWSGTTTASSLQQVYNNTSTSPASIITTSSAKNILFQAGVGFDNANVFQVGNSAAAPVINIDTRNTATGANLASNGGVESGSTGWTAFAGTGSASISQNTNASNLASGLGSIDVNITGAGTGGVNNALSSTALAANQLYNVSFNIKSSSGTPTIAVTYLEDGSVLDATCTVPTNGTVNSTSFFKYTCYFTTGASGQTSSNVLRIAQTDSTARHLYIDNLAVVAQNSTGTQNSGALQVGGPLSQSLTLFTLDTFSADPFTGTVNQNLYGSMYYNTTLGRIQCYESSGWGSCGAAPDSGLILEPEYAGAVLAAANYTSETPNSHIGTMTANICSGSSRLSIQPTEGTICGSTEEYNYYKWTTSQVTSQSYGIYVKYQLPPTFGGFMDASTIKMYGRSSNTTDANVYYTLYDAAGNECGSTGSRTLITTSANSWIQQSLSADETNPGASGCTFNPNDVITFRIDMYAKNNAFAYAGRITFTMKGK